MEEGANSSSLPRVLVTGASGFIGGQMIASPAPFRIRAALRSPLTAGSPIETVRIGSIDSSTDWSAALEGVAHVVHLAARVHVMRPTAEDRAAFEETNVLGTERLARAAARAGVKRFVFLSSIKVNGDRTEGRPFTATDPPDPRDDYGRSKLAAEEALGRVAAETALAVSIVRPPLVYGPNVKANFRRLLGFAARSVPLPLGAIHNRRSLVSVWNLCDLLWTLLRRPQPAAGVYLVDDGEPISTPDLIRTLAQAMHRPDRLFGVPVSLLRGLAALAGQSAEVGRLCDSLEVDSSATRRDLSWNPVLSLKEGLARTAQWYPA